MTSPASAPVARARSHIGRYELCAEIASGGMGRVYLARSVGPAGFDKLVALKCIHPELSSERAFVDMFFDEARIAARIAHPNVCGVFDFGEADGRYYLAMEYLAGETVARLGRKLARAEARDAAHDVLAARIVAEAAEGLHAAHSLVDEHGRSLEVVHRDVSPQNLFVTYDGGVRVVDFGIASAQGRLHRTTTGSVKGKFAYMAPEQMRREKADHRADVWALGVVLWELLTGERLFRASGEVDIILAVLNDPVRKPTDVRPDVDPALEAIVMQALEKDRDHRTPTARALAQALQRWIVKRGEVVGMAELAGLMERTFPQERRATMERLDAARRGETSDEVALPPSESELKSTAGLKTRDIDFVDEAPLSGSEAIPRASSDGPQRSRAPWVVAATSALVAVLAVGWIATGGVAPRTEPAVADVPPVAPAASPPAIAAVPTEPALSPPSTPPASAAEPVAVPVAELAPAATSRRESRARDRHRTEAPPVAEAASTGSVHVETPGGWADVYVDGRRAGRTPLDLELPVGRASIELRPFGLAPPAGDASLRRSITVGARPARVVVPIEG